MLVPQQLNPDSSLTYSTVYIEARIIISQVNTGKTKKIKLEKLVLKERQLELDILVLIQSIPVLTQILKIPSE